MWVSSVMVPVANQDRALRFYVEKLGFSLKVDVPCPEQSQRWIELVRPDTEIELVLFTGPDFENMVGKNMNVVFATNDIDRSYEKLINKGVEVLGPPKEEFWGSYVTFKDSEGNLFCLGQSKEQKYNVKRPFSYILGCLKCWWVSRRCKR